MFKKRFDAQTLLTKVKLMKVQGKTIEKFKGEKGTIRLYQQSAKKKIMKIKIS